MFMSRNIKGWDAYKKQKALWDIVPTERFSLVLNERLDSSDIFRFQAFFALDNVKTDLLAFIQRLETAGLNRTEMHKYIRAALLLDEAEALAFVEPLYFTFWHNANPPFSKFPKSNYHCGRNTKTAKF